MSSIAPAGNRIVVGVADCRVSADPSETLVTYALGSCIAVAIYDPKPPVGGLLHFMLPDSRLALERAAQNPYIFADTGIPRLFRDAYAAGAAKGRLLVSIAGGARSIDIGADFSDVGRKNIIAVKGILWTAGVLVHAEQTGGREPRELRLPVGTGKIWIK